LKAAFGLSPFVFAFVLSVAVSWFWKMQNIVRNMQVERDVRLISFFIIFTPLAVLIFVNDPLWCQRFLSVTLGINAIFLAHGLWRSPQSLQNLSGMNDGPNWFIKLWARWRLASLLLLILVNESAISYATLTEWIIMWSMAPVIVYCLMFWSIAASWEEDSNQE